MFCSPFVDPLLDLMDNQRIHERYDLLLVEYCDVDCAVDCDVDCAVDCAVVRSPGVAWLLPLVGGLAQSLGWGSFWPCLVGSMARLPGWARPIVPGC